MKQKTTLAKLMKWILIMKAIGLFFGISVAVAADADFPSRRLRSAVNVDIDAEGVRFRPLFVLISLTKSL
jgi:hypothetical protein